MICVDTSFYISASDKNDSNFTKAYGLLELVRRVEKFTTEDLLKETLTIISQRQGKKVSIEFYHKLIEDTTILPVTSEIYKDGLDIFLDYKLNKNISLIDCTTVAACKNEGIKEILTFDSHFKALGLKVIS